MKILHISPFWSISNLLMSTDVDKSTLFQNTGIHRLKSLESNQKGEGIFAWFIQVVEF